MCSQLLHHPSFKTHRPIVNRALTHLLRVKCVSVFTNPALDYGGRKYESVCRRIRLYVVAFLMYCNDIARFFSSKSSGKRECEGGFYVRV